MRAETRHQLKQDRFRGTTIQVAEKTVDWSVEHKGKLIAGLVALVVIAGAAAGGWYYLSVQDQKASVALGGAVRTWETQVRAAGTPAEPDVPSFANSKDRATEAHKKFQAIVQQYPHTRAGDFARYFTGLTAADLGNYAEAERELQSVASSRNADLSSIARLALASVDRKQGHTHDAIEIYKSLAEKPTTTVSKAMAQLELAATLLADMQPLEAKRIYEQVQKENPSTPAAQIAAKALQDMK
ncbi:MAG TPA: tetratricopeptide repeat protein [Terriglobales bacterium]